MVALRLVSNPTSPPPHVTRRECISARRMKSLKETWGRWDNLKTMHKDLDSAEKNFSDLQSAVANGTAKKEPLLHAAEVLNSHCDALRAEYRRFLGAHMSSTRPLIDYTDANIGEVDQMSGLKEVLINARARRALMDYCGKDLTTAAERIATGADLTWAEREFDYTSQGWIAFKKELGEQLRKLI
jgi:hypothetical protein